MIVHTRTIDNFFFFYDNFNTWSLIQAQILEGGGERGGLKETLRKGARIKSLLFFSLYILLSLVRWRSSTSRQSLVQSLEQNIVKFNLYLKKIYLSLSFHAFRNFPHLVIVCLSKLIRGIFHFLLVFFFFLLHEM